MTVLSVEIENGMALICIDNPPVNAAGHDVRQGVCDAIKQAHADPQVKSMALYCAGRTFVAGADIREFDKPAKDPSLAELCSALETSALPVVAVLHGTALGGGLEIALSCHARVALPGTRLGLPEVALGLLPGAGGTQRLPRLTKSVFAVQMITSGKPVTEDVALENGIIDKIIEGTPKEVALIASQMLIEGKLEVRKTSELSSKLEMSDVKASAARLAKMKSGGEAELRALKATEASLGEFTQGCALERALFVAAKGAPLHAALKHAFFAERVVTRIPEADATPREITSVGVVGGGTMGAGIATSMLLSGLPVVLVETKKERADGAYQAIAKNLAEAVKRGKLSAEIGENLLAFLRTSTEMEALAKADLVVEAVFEDMNLKKEIFAAFDRICKPGSILATNTSNLDVDEIAACTSRPEDVIGLHFFSPAHKMRLLEVVVGEKTAPDVTLSGFRLAKQLGKIAVRAGVCDGFIGNRVLGHYRKSIDYMLLDGADAGRIDLALEKFGFAMGPLAVSDLVGLDIGWATRKRRAVTRPAEERYVEVGDRICEAGWYGRKTGKGFYIYGENGKTTNPKVAEFVAQEQAAKGLTPRVFDDQDIVDRYMTAMVCEAARVVEDGIALRPADVDVVFLFGYGFPRHRGGPLHYADTVGAAELVRRIEAWAQEDSYYWQVPAILLDMAKTNSTFAGLAEGK